MKFIKFKNEIKKRDGTGYHLINNYEEDAAIEFASRGIFVCNSYMEFVNQIGYGSFFDGSLVFFQLQNITSSIINLTAQIKNLGFDDIVVIGYDGTTSGFYGLENRRDSSKVYWIDLTLKSKTLVNENFEKWVDELPEKLFNAKIYAGFKKIKDVEGIRNVINERMKFRVALKSFDKQLVKPPGKENDFLPRYNRVVLVVTKEQESDLDLLTIVLKREGSPIGDDNKDYITLNVSNLKMGVPQEFENYLFDPFNLPFEQITCMFDYKIDLGSKMRVRYLEIQNYL